MKEKSVIGKDVLLSFTYHKLSPWYRCPGIKELSSLSSILSKIARTEWCSLSRLGTDIFLRFPISWHSGNVWIWINMVLKRQALLTIHSTFHPQFFLLESSSSPLHLCFPGCCSLLPVLSEFPPISLTSTHLPFALPVHSSLTRVHLTHKEQASTPCSQHQVGCCHCKPRHTPRDLEKVVRKEVPSFCAATATIRSNKGKVCFNKKSSF